MTTTKKKWMLALNAILLGCASSPPESAPGPIPLPDISPSPVRFLVSSSGHDSACLIYGIDARGNTSGQICETVAVVENCVIRHCEPKPKSDGWTSIDLGRVTVTSDCLGTEVPLSGEFHSASGKAPFAPGEMVHVSGAGSADLEPFEIDVKVPSAPTGRMFGGCGPVEYGLPECRTSDPSPIVKWTGGSDYVIVELLNSTTLSDYLTCAFDAAPQKGRIPAAAIARMPREYSYGVRIWSGVLIARSGEVGVEASNPNDGQLWSASY